MRTEWKGYIIEGEFVGTKAAIWDPDSYDRHHVITVTNKESGQYVKFDYYAPSIDDEKDLLDALECYLTDATLGGMEFEEFCRELGYDIPKSILTSWKACNKAKVNAERMFGENLEELREEFEEELRIQELMGKLEK